MQPQQKARILYTHSPTGLSQQDSCTDIQTANWKSAIKANKQLVNTRQAFDIIN